MKPQYIVSGSIFLTVALLCSLGANAQERERGGEPWSDMNYGNFTTLSLEVSPGNIAYKGIAIRLDAGEGGVSEGSEFVLFETDTLRYAGGWFGEQFIDWKAIGLNGEHEIHPSVVGDVVFSNQNGPGWGRPSDGSFVDERVLGKDGVRYGPTVRDWMHWKGLYVDGDRVALKYTVGDTEVLEHPGVEGGAGQRTLSRTINLGPHAQELILQVANQESTQPQLQAFDHPNSPNKQLAFFEGNAFKAKPRGNESAGARFGGDMLAKVANSTGLFAGGDYSITARFRTTKGGTILSLVSKKGAWDANSKSLYVEDGKVVFSVGSDKVVQNEGRVDDGDWHQVSLIGRDKGGSIGLFVDGDFVGDGEVNATGGASGHVVRLGYTTDDFPKQSRFEGDLMDARVYSRALGTEDIERFADTENMRRLGRRLRNDKTIVAWWNMSDLEGNSIEDRSQNDHVARISGEIPSVSQVTVVAMVGGDAGMAWITTAEGDLRLRIPASSESASLKLLFSHVSSTKALDPFIETVQASAAPGDLQSLTKGGAERWPERIMTKGTLGKEDGAYQVDTITPPFENPYQAWLRFGGFDFFGDDSKAALGTWNGDVWIVSGIDDSLENLEWKRFASGLFQPLGIKILNDDVYVLGRDQITVLRDLNGDGEADFYENFNNDAQVTEHFHEFALDLQVGLDGDFYYNKGGRHGADSVVPQHGTLLHVARDGSSTEILARGFRAPNGLGIGPQGEFMTSDNEGHWTPANRINWVEPGRGDDTKFYGYRWGYIEGLDIQGYTPPLCWIPAPIDRSPGTFIWVPDRRWGPLRDRVMTISYGMGQMFHVMYEEIDGVVQGGVVRFPLEFDTGVTRVKFRRRDGQLYTCGLFGWSGNKTESGGFYRVRWTGKDLYMPEEIHIAKDGVSLTFTDPLDAESATDVGNYGIKHWNYEYREEYGSEQFKMDGSEGQDTLQATQAAISADKRTVYLKIPGIREVMQMEIKLNLKAANGTVVRHDIYNTINKMGTKTLNEMMGGGQIFSRKMEKKVGTEGKVSGLAQKLSSLSSNSAAVVDTRLARMPALYVNEGGPPSPFVGAGRFNATWKGYIEADLNQEFVFSLEGRGTARLRINGVEAAVLSGEALASGETVALKSGVNAIQLDYTSPVAGDAAIQVLWESSDVPREPIPATRYWHDEDQAVLHGEQLRDGRGLLAEYRCLTCHTPGDAATTAAFRMPELTMDAPALDSAGQKFNEAWMGRWILDPQAIQADASMPRMFHGDDAAMNAGQSNDIAAYLATLGSVKKNEVSGDLSGTFASGEVFFSELGCIACHRKRGEGLLDEGDTRRTLDYVGAKWKPAALASFLSDPSHDYAWIRMPNFRLTAEESGSLAQFLLANSGADASEAGLATPSGDPVRGRELLASSGCLGCHTLDGAQNVASAPAFERIVASDWLRGCMAETLPGSSAAPDFNMTAAERKALQYFSASDWKSLKRYAPVEFAARQFDNLNCLACHARDGDGDYWSVVLRSLASEAESEESVSVDDFFGEPTATEESVFVSRPPLDWAGEKLRAGWNEQLLAGALDYKPRPLMTARMPGFAAYAEGLAHGLSAEHGFSPDDEPEGRFDSELANTGLELIGIESGFSCVACHAIGEERALVGTETETINFALVPKRLRRSYFDRFLLDPPRLLPGTKMPQFVNSDMTTALKGVFDGDALRQTDAIWNFIVQLSETTTIAKSE